MNIMIDIETLGVSSRAPILSIGACSFDQEGIHRRFYTAVILELGAPFEPDGSTLAWWMEQDEEARAVFNDPARKPIGGAMQFLHAWICSVQEDHTIKVWAKPPRFDITILEHAFNHSKVRVPWHHRNVLDMRTLTHALDLKGKQAPAPTGTSHNALDDAIYQAQYVRTLLYPQQLELSL